MQKARHTSERDRKTFSSNKTQRTVQKAIESIGTSHPTFQFQKTIKMKIVIFTSLMSMTETSSKNGNVPRSQSHRNQKHDAKKVSLIAPSAKRDRFS
jgi:hypothetical protein